MKKLYVSPEVIVHGTVEEITKGGRNAPNNPVFNPWNGKKGKHGHGHGHGHGPGDTVGS